MSEFYGRLRGQTDNEVTRCGSKISGISATVETWQSVVATRFFTDIEQSSSHMAHIAIRDKIGNFTGFDFFIDADAIAACASVREELEDELGNVEEALRLLDKKAQQVLAERKER